MAKPSTPKNAPGSRIDQHCTEIICAKFQIPITFCSILSGRPQLIGLHSSPVMLAVTSGRSIDRIIIQQIPFRGIRVAEYRYAE